MKLSKAFPFFSVFTFPHSGLYGVFFLPFLLILFIILTGKTSMAQDTSGKDPFLKAVKEELGQKFIIEYNPSQTLVLCKRNPDELRSIDNSGFKYLIYDLHKGEILFKESLPAGDAAWINNYQIEVCVRPGIVTEDSIEKPNCYILDLKAGKKLPVSTKSRSHNKP